MALKEAWTWRQRGLNAEYHLTAMTIGQESGQPKASYRKGAGDIRP